MLLEDAEKVRFLAYLKIEAESAEQIVTQMQTIGAPITLIDQNRILATACRVIIARLESGETMKI